MATFTKELYKLLRISAVNSLQPPDGWTDGKSEPGNQGLPAGIHQPSPRQLGGLVAHRNVLLEFKARTDRKIPFEATKGYQPMMGMEPSRKGKERAGDFVAEMARVFKETEVVLKQTAEDMKRFYD